MRAVNQRFSDFLKYLNISGVDFARSINVSPSKISGWLNDNYAPNMESLIAISQKYRNLNLSWLLLGEGEMLLTDNKHDTQKNRSENEQNILIEILKSLAKDIAKLESKQEILIKDMELCKEELAKKKRAI